MILKLSFTRRPRRSALLLSLAMLFGAVVSRPASAAAHEVRLPLREGKVHLADVSQILLQEMHLPGWKLGDGTINLNGIRGSLFVKSLNAALGDGCQLTVSDDALVFHFDPHELPHTAEQARHAVRDFVANDFPDATAAQAKRWGLFLPAQVDPNRPLVILIHGLNTGTGMLRPMGEMLEARGFQVAYFGYPADQAIHDDDLLLESKLAALHQAYPGIRINLVAHSMGGLVARAYVEGPRYANDVDHLILVGTPNYGSDWAKYHLIQDIGFQYIAWRTDPEWRLSWMITDGMGEAARDLKPHSRFLRTLDGRDRRANVQYTIIAGSKSRVSDIEGSAIGEVAGLIPKAAAKWPVLGGWRSKLLHEEATLREETGMSDGPVPLRSARLKGVNDIVVLPADHVSLFLPDLKDNPPAAFETICDRLRK